MAPDSATGLLEFVQPLLEAAGDDLKEMGKALKFSMMIWNVAVSAETGSAEMWARLGLMAMNLTTALRKMEARAAA